MPLVQYKCASSTCVTLSLLLAALLASAGAITPPTSEWVAGTASFFGGPQNANSNAYKLTIDSGSCGYGNIDPRLYPFYDVAGLHASNPIVLSRPLAACGACLEMRCADPRGICHPGGSVSVVITDQCVSECNATNVNMHVFSFERLAPLRFGRIAVRYRLVPCEPTDPVIIHVSDYRVTDGGWLRLAFKSIASDAGLIAVEAAPAGSDVAAQGRSVDPASPWTHMLNTFGAVWEASNVSAPLDLRLTNSLGQVLVIRDAIAVQGITGDIETTAQFPAVPQGSSGAAGDGVAAAQPPAAAAGGGKAQRPRAGSPPLPGAADAAGITVGVALPQPPQQMQATNKRAGAAGADLRAPKAAAPGAPGAGGRRMLLT